MGAFIAGSLIVDAIGKTLTAGKRARNKTRLAKISKLETQVRGENPENIWQNARIQQNNKIVNDKISKLNNSMEE